MISPVRNVGDPSTLLSAPVEGMRRGAAKAAQAGNGLAKGEDLPGNMVELIEAAVLVKANAIAARTADELIGSILNVKR